MPIPAKRLLKCLACLPLLGLAPVWALGPAQPPAITPAQVKVLLEDRPDGWGRETGTVAVLGPRGEPLPLEPLEAAALFGAERCFRAWTSPAKLKALGPLERGRLLGFSVRPHPPQSELLEAMEDGDSPQAQTQYRAELEPRRKQKIVILKYLLDHACDSNLADAAGLAPLHYAAYWGRAEAAQLLLSRGARLDAVSGAQAIPRIREPLHGPATADYMVSVSQASAAAAVDAKTPLELALCSRYHLHADPMSTALNPVTEADQQATVKCLLDHKPKMDHASKSGMTPLMCAAFYLFNVELSEIDSLDRNSRHAFGHPLWAASVLKTMLDLGADPGAVAERGYTALAFAVRAGLDEGVPVLAPRTPRAALSPGEDRPIPFDPVQQALAFALLHGDGDVAKTLLELPVSVSNPLPNGIFPEPGSDFDFEPGMDLLAAAVLGGPQMVELLAPQVTDAARLASARKTAVEGLFQREDVRALRAVVQQRKDVELGRRTEALALALTLNSYDAATFRTLVQQGARPHPEMDFPWSRLFYMAETGGDRPDGKAAALELLRCFKDWHGRKDLDEVFFRLILLPEPPSGEVLNLLEASAFPFQELKSPLPKLRERERVPGKTRERLEYLLGAPKQP
jgi:ankyrin repeat protein